MSSLKSLKERSYYLFDEIASTYDLINHLLSLGLDKYWRKQMLKHISNRTQGDALDIACGTGDLTLLLVEDPRISNVTGIDLSTKMLELGQKKIEKKRLNRSIFLEVGDGVNIPYPDHSFALVTIAFGIRNFSDPVTSLQNIYRILKPGGRALIMEFSLPKNRLFKSLYLFYFRHILPLIGRLISRHREAYRYLNKSVEDFPHGPSFIKLMEQAGFKRVQCQRLTLGIVSIYKGDKIDF